MSGLNKLKGDLMSERLRWRLRNIFAGVCIACEVTTVGVMMHASLSDESKNKRDGEFDTAALIALSGAIPGVAAKAIY
jgi:hypothetical protein